MRIAILGSTRGTNLSAIVNAISQHKLDATIEIVLSNKSDAGILERAASYGLNTAFINPIGLTREQYDAQITDVLKQHRIDLVVLVGYMRILSKQFVDAWENKIINVHPSLLPAFAGKMDLAVHQAVLDDKVKKTGCTVHFVTAEVDAGPIILQTECPVFATDTPETLKARVQALEGPTLVEAINIIASN